MVGRRIVIALGGNAILRHGQAGTYSEQIANIEAACDQVAGIAEMGYDIALTHGNGPQVGNILDQNKIASARIPPVPLDACGAESQGLIGYVVQQCLMNSLRRKGIRRPVVTVVSQVIVSSNDAAFANPSKPIGGFLDELEARRLSELERFAVNEEAGKGWRRVVASPLPMRIVEAAAIEGLMSEGCIPIACGGGGIPVIEAADGDLRGVEAVIDKDLTAQLLAREVKAEVLLILTDVDGVMLGFGTPRVRVVAEMSLDEAQDMLDRGEFAPGTMRPKMKATIAFLRSGGRSVHIGNLTRASDVLLGKAGTTVR